MRIGEWHHVQQEILETKISIKFLPTLYTTTQLKKDKQRRIKMKGRIVARKSNHRLIGDTRKRKGEGDRIK